MATEPAFGGREMLRAAILFAASGLALMLTSTPAPADPATKSEGVGVVAKPSPSDSLGRDRGLSASRREVMRGLRNPGTARFRSESLSAAADSKTYTLCGWVEAENETGRRAGFVPFIATNDGTVLYALPDPYGSFPHLWRAHCNAAGTRQANAPRQVLKASKAADSQVASVSDPVQRLESKDLP